MGYLWDIFCFWGPIAALIGAMVYSTRRMVAARMAHSAQHWEAQLAEQRRHNEALEKILARLTEKFADK